MSQIIPFEGAQLPAYLNQAAPDVNSEITAHAGGGFPVMSIKGKVFTLVREGERKVLRNPRDPDAAASSIDVTIIRVNKNKSKVYYADGYSEGTEQKKPDCWSNDGIRPDASVENPRSTACASCPFNQWGSKVSDDGRASKGKACQDTVRIAIAAPNRMNDPMLLRVPPASIRSLGEYGSQLAKRRVPFTAVVTRISFDVESPSPKLLFRAVGFLPEHLYAEAQEMRDSEVVHNIVEGFQGVAHEDSENGSSVVEHPENVEPAKPKAAAKAAPKPRPASKKVTKDEAQDAIAAALETPAEEAKPAPAPKPAPTKAEADDAMAFAVDAEPAPAPAPAPAKQAQVVEDISSMEVSLDLDSLSFDDD